MKSKKFEKKFEIVEKYVEKAFENASACHDYDHTIRVFNNACELLKLIEGADYQVVYVSAMLHDIGRTYEFKKKGKVCHAKIGAEMAKGFLLENDFKEDFIEKVCHCIRTHRFRGEELHPETIEAKIVYDADKLDSLGAVGIARSFMFAAKIGAKLHNSKTSALQASEYSEHDTAYREYLVKLSKVSGKMQTIEGKAFAIKYTKFMDDFFKEMNIQNKGIKL